MIDVINRETLILTDFPSTFLSRRSRLSMLNACIANRDTFIYRIQYTRQNACIFASAIALTSDLVAVNYEGSLQDDLSRVH